MSVPVTATRDPFATPADPFATPAGSTPVHPLKSAPVGRVQCPHCAAHYTPGLVKWACPVCRTPSPGVQPPRRAPLRDDDRLILIVALATLANLVVLGILAIAVLS